MKWKPNLASSVPIGIWISNVDFPWGYIYTRCEFYAGRRVPLSDLVRSPLARSHPFLQSVRITSALQIVWKLIDSPQIGEHPVMALLCQFDV